MQSDEYHVVEGGILVNNRVLQQILLIRTKHIVHIEKQNDNKETMKKYFELAKINSQIRSINRELMAENRGPVIISSQLYSPVSTSDRFRETEKSHILRNSLNDLIDRKQLIRNQ